MNRVAAGCVTVLLFGGITAGILISGFLRARDKATWGDLVSEDRLTAEACRSLRVGMSIDQVKGILGEPSADVDLSVSFPYRSLSWRSGYPETPAGQVAPSITEATPLPGRRIALNFANGYLKDGKAENIPGLTDFRLGGAPSVVGIWKLEISTDVKRQWPSDLPLPTVTMEFKSDGTFQTTSQIMNEGDTISGVFKQDDDAVTTTTKKINGKTVSGEDSVERIQLSPDMNSFELPIVKIKGLRRMVRQ